MKKDVDDFGNKENVKPPSCVVVIYASQNNTDLAPLHYPVQLNGIEPPDIKLFITRLPKQIGSHMLLLNTLYWLFSFLGRSIYKETFHPI